MFTIRCANKYKSESTNCENITEISQISEACSLNPVIPLMD